MLKRESYSSRKYGAQIDLGKLKELFCVLFSKLEEENYFDESMGYRCIDGENVLGTMGSDISRFFSLP
jgi:hypothetical protein